MVSTTWTANVVTLLAYRSRYHSAFDEKLNTFRHPSMGDPNRKRLVDGIGQSINDAKPDVIGDEYADLVRYISDYEGRQIKSAAALGRHQGFDESTHLSPLTTQRSSNNPYHQRLSSVSSIASAGPASPYASNLMSHSSSGGHEWIYEPPDPAMSSKKHYGGDPSCSADSRSTIPKLDRTMSDIYQDELYSLSAAAPAISTQTHSSPNQANIRSQDTEVFKKRLEDANSKYLTAMSPSFASAAKRAEAAAARTNPSPVSHYSSLFLSGEIMEHNDDKGFETREPFSDVVKPSSRILLLKYRTTMDADTDGYYVCRKWPSKSGLPTPAKDQLRRRRLELPVGINGIQHSSIADTGAAENIMDLETVHKLGLPLSTRPESILKFSLCDGRVVRSIGKTVAQVTFSKGKPTPTQCFFYVLEKCAVPLIMGKKFLESTQTLTKYKHRLQERLASLGRFSRILEIGSSSQRLSCFLDGKDVLVNPDSGSEINVMSLAFAMKHGYYRQKSTRLGRIVLGDGSEAETAGEVTASVVLGNRYGKSYQEVFHILPGLSSDILLGEEILYESDAFSQFAEYFTNADSELNLFDLNVLRWKGLLETKCLQSLKALSGRRPGQRKPNLRLPIPFFKLD